MLKKNLPYMITYILMILLFLLGAIFYRQAFLAILLFLCCILPPISIALTRYTLRRIQYEVACTVSYLQAGNDLCITIRLKNPTCFPLLNCKMTFTYENLFFQNPTIHTLSIPAEPKKDRFFRLPFQTSSAGMFLFIAKSFQVTDYLHLVTFTLPFSKELKIPVLPSEYKAPLPTIPKVVFSEDEKVTDNTRGILTSDILQLRDYHPGDRLQNIHWKMSAKSDDLLVKEFERSLDLRYVLLPELSGKDFQKMLSLYYALGLDLVKKGELFKTAIYHSADRTFSFIDVADEDSLLQSIYRLYYEPIISCTSQYEQFCSMYPNINGIVRIHEGQLLFEASEVIA